MSKNSTRPRGVKALTVHVARLGEALKSRGHHLKTSDLIEVAAHAFGARDSNVLAAAQKSGALDLARPRLTERVTLNDGSALLVLRHEVEPAAFAISPALLTSVSPAVIAGPSGRLFDLGEIDPETTDPVTEGTAMITLTIYTAVVEHKHGNNTYAALSEAALDAQVAQYCRDSWDEVSDKSDLDPASAADSDLISTYFEHVFEEYLETASEAVSVKLSEMQALIAEGREVPKTAKPPVPRKPAPRSIEAWRADVAAGKTEMGYGEWILRQPKERRMIDASASRQYWIDDMAYDALTRAVADGAPLRGKILALGQRMADNMPAGTAVLNLTPSECETLILALQTEARRLSAQPDGDATGQAYVLKSLVDRFSDDAPIFLTNGCCENTHADDALFQELGLTGSEQNGAFYPLIPDEERYVIEEEVSYGIGVILPAYTGLYRGKKYLMPLIEIYHDADDDGLARDNAEYIETRLVPRITPHVEAAGGFIHTDIDAEDDRHRVMVLLPFSAAEGCPDVESWLIRLVAILDGKAELTVCDVQSGLAIATDRMTAKAPGEPVKITDASGRVWAGTVILETVGGRTDHIAMRVESIDGHVQDDRKVPVLEMEVAQDRWMTRADAAQLKPGQRLISLCEGSGDVEPDDDAESDEFVERSYEPGDWLTVESVEDVGGRQGLAVTVTSRNGVINTFDEADDGGKYPFLIPHV